MQNTIRFAGQLCAFLMLCAFFLCMVPLQGHAQSTFPVPGIGGASTPAPEEVAPTTPTDPAGDLVRILRDPAAREALIAELEQGSQAVPPPTPAVEDRAPEAVSDPPTANIGIAVLRLVRDSFVQDLQAFIARARSVPYNTELALRAFDTEIIQSMVSEILGLFLVSYGILYATRFALIPLVRRAARSGLNRAWVGKLWRRGLVSVLQIVPIFLASFITVFYFALTNPETEVSIAQANYLGAFVMVELVRTALRFVTSPATPELRLVPLPDRGARSLQFHVTVSTILLGYGQLLFVPVASAETSVFVGRALSSLLGTVSLIYLIAVVLLKRHDVADWLRRNEGEGALDQLMGAIAERWHVPVLIYLGVLLVIVGTHTGNVLLPMLNATLSVIGVVLVGYIASSLARSAAKRRVRLPQPVTRRLPMLESRVNGLVPAFFAVIRVLILVVVVIALLGALHVYAPTRFFGSAAGSAFLSGLLGVAVVAFIAVTAYLIFASWVDYQLNPFVGTAPTPRMITLLTLLRNAVTIVLVIIALMVSLSQLGLDIGPLLASAGVLGLAISFGAQKMVEDIITGVFIQLENAMNVGDVVDVGGVVGTVEKLTVRSVTLRDLKGVVHMIPFSSAAMISNYMRDFSYYVCDMGVAYRENVEEVKTAMFDAFAQLQEDEEQARFLLGDLEWFGLNSFDASAITLRARIKTAPGQQWSVGRAYNDLLKTVFDARGIEIPFPHQTLYFGEDRKGNAPPVQVVLHTAEPETSKGTPVSTPDPTPKTETPKVLDTPDGPDEI